MGYKNQSLTETNSSVMRKLVKIVRANNGEIHCKYCGWHSVENKYYKKHGVRKPRKKDHR